MHSGYTSTDLHISSHKGPLEVGSSAEKEVVLTHQNTAVWHKVHGCMIKGVMPGSELQDSSPDLTRRTINLATLTSNSTGIPLGSRL